MYARRKNKTWNDAVAGRDVSIGILQLGKSTKKGYKFTDVPYDFESFLAARIFWDAPFKRRGVGEIILFVTSFLLYKINIIHVDISNKMLNLRLP